MAETITVNADGTVTIKTSKTVSTTVTVKKEDVARAIADITLELNKVQARLDYQKALLAKLGG